MIFHCGSCQAKYQLPDERVAGRTVRMKCRKCGHFIEVKGPSPVEERAAVGGSQGWYAGIDGRPTGPMNEEELAAKIAASVVTGETLVWREGFDTWIPLASVSELAHLLPSVSMPPAAPETSATWAESPPPADSPPAAEPQPRESAVSRLSAPGPSLGTLARPSVPRAVPSARKPLEAPPSAPEVSPAPSASFEKPSAETSAPSATLTGAAGFAFAAPAPPATLPSPEPRFEAPSSASSSTEAAGGAGEQPPASSAAATLEATALAGLGDVAPASIPAPLGGSSIAPPPPAGRAESLAPIAAPRSRVHPAAWALVGLGGVLVGVVAGISLAKGPQQEAPAAVTTTASAQVSQPASVASAEPAPAVEQPSAVASATAEEPAPPEGAEPAPAEAAPAEPAPAQVQKAVNKAADSSKSRQSTTTAKAPEKEAPAMNNLSSLSGLAAGPTPGPTKSSSSGGGGPLSQAEVERVVQSHRAFVKRRCWELALATKTEGAPSSARVMTTITIAPNGSVTSASATGGEGYPGLASCVAGQVRGWKFPPSEGGTVNVPFVFAAQ